MKFVRVIVALAFGLLSAAAFGQNGMVTVRAAVVGSTHLEIQGADQTASGSGTATFTATIGTLSGMQAAPSGFTLTRDKDSATLSSVLRTRALKANLPNTGYTLVAQLQRALPDGVTWSLNGVALSANNPSSVAAGTFGTADSLNLQIDVKGSASAALLDDAIVFRVTLN